MYTQAARISKPKILFVFLIFASFASIPAACVYGPLPIPFEDVLSILAHSLGINSSLPSDIPESWPIVITELRLSRSCLAWLVGAALSVSGVVLQGILRNPLADPFTLGVSSGAAFGATLIIYSGISISSGGWMAENLIPLAALGGAALAITAVTVLARAGKRNGRDSLILAGVVIATFLAALISLLKSLDEESVGAIVFWIMGSFQGRGWGQLCLFLPYALAGFFLVFFYSRELDIICLGDAQAMQLGVNTRKIRLNMMLGAGLLAGAAVAVSGVIGFVGLIVPHLLRIVLGAEHRPLLIFSAVLGGLLLLWSDVLARTILPGGAELPVGVITALLGGPFFCLLLCSKAPSS